MLLLEPRLIYAANLSQRLRAHEFAVDVAHSEAAALDVLRNGDPDIVMVSTGTGGPGAALLDRVRQMAQVGVVAITDADVMPLFSSVGLTIAKDLEELVVRIRNALRNYRIDTESSPHGSTDRRMQTRKVGDLEVDVTSRRVSLCGNTVALARIEFSILTALSACPGADS